MLAHGIALATLAMLGLQVVQAVSSGLDLAGWALGIPVFTLVTDLVGWLLAWRRPRIALGWILLAAPLLLTLQGPALLVGGLLARSAPGAAAWLLWYGGDSQWSWVPPVGLLFSQLPLRFPNGSLPTPRWRWCSRAAIAVLVVVSALLATTGPTVGSGLRNPTYVDWGGATDLLNTAASLLLLVCLIGSVASVFVRYRRAGAVERAQVRWVFWALAMLVALFLVAGLETALIGSDTAPGVTGRIGQAFDSAIALAYCLTPLAILFAVLRRGLYSIDRIISRTASYAIVTVVVVGTYALVVLSTSWLLHGARAVGVALATLAAAVVFLPVLRRVRRRIDRVFNRSEYDAERIVAAFGEHVRTGADPQTTGDRLVLAVGQALEPATIGLWRRP